MARAADVEHQPAGILPSEMFLFVSLCLGQQVDRVFESGRKFGYSTRVLCQWLDRWKLRSCEMSPQIEHDKRLRLDYSAVIVSGDGMNVLPRWVMASFHDSRIAILCDGPKDMRAFKLCRRMQDHLVFYAVHDCLTTDELYTRTASCRRFFSRDEEWERRYAGLDDDAVRRSDYGSREEMTREAFGMVVYPGGKWREDSGEH
jgi:hypothetical protein